MSSSSEVQYGGGDRGFPTKCDCGLRVVPLLLKTQENPGRLFYRCISKKDVEDAIPKLEIIDREITKTKTEVEELRTLIEDLKKDVARSQIEIRNWKALKAVCLLCVLWLCC
ncbi:PREDICTED: uncharacterized protein At1g43920, Chloroplastic-like [Brassica oleracea var. oleracea]|nr:PREDICTED: uncharacterized protein At1g43920, Chloroplastic-like [Brassica oleracea var. oleracea]